MGFLPSKRKARGDALAEVAALRATLVFYESGPRLSESLAAMAEHLGDREAAVSREISKAFEETVRYFAVDGLEKAMPGVTIVNGAPVVRGRSEEHTSELQSLMRNSYAVFCLKKKNK